MIQDKVILLSKIHLLRDFEITFIKIRFCYNQK